MRVSETTDTAVLPDGRRVTMRWDELVGWIIVDPDEPTVVMATYPGSDPT